MFRLLLAAAVATSIALLGQLANAQDVYDRIDKFGTCPYVFGSGDSAVKVYLGISTGDKFAVAAIKEQVTKIAKDVKKGKLKPQCALKDGKWKLQKVVPDEVRIFWWYNINQKSIGWIATRKVEDRVYILKSNAGKAYVGKLAESDKTSFKLAKVGKVTHKLKILVKFAKPGDTDPETKLPLGKGYDYYYAIKVM